MIRELMINLGYDDSDVLNILNDSHTISFKESTLCIKVEEIYSFFLDCGYTREEIVKMTRGFIGIYGFDLKNLKSKIEFFFMMYFLVKNNLADIFAKFDLTR